VASGERVDERRDRQREPERDDDLENNAYFFVNRGTVLAIESSAQSMSSSDAA
jgi:hypothetical protein